MCAIIIFFTCIDYIKHLSKDHPDFVNAKGIKDLIALHSINFIYHMQLLWQLYRAHSNT